MENHLMDDEGKAASHALREEEEQREGKPLERKLPQYYDVAMVVVYIIIAVILYSGYM